MCISNQIRARSGVHCYMSILHHVIKLTIKHKLLSFLGSDHPWEKWQKPTKRLEDRLDWCGETGAGNHWGEWTSVANIPYQCLSVSHINRLLSTPTDMSVAWPVDRLASITWWLDRQETWARWQASGPWGMEVRGEIIIIIIIIIHHVCWEQVSGTAQSAWQYPISNTVSNIEGLGYCPPRSTERGNYVCKLEHGKNDIS